MLSSAYPMRPARIYIIHLYKIFRVETVNHWRLILSSGCTFAQVSLPCRGLRTKTFEWRDDIRWNCSTVLLQTQERTRRKRRKRRERKKSLFLFFLWVKKKIRNKYLFSLGRDLRENGRLSGILVENWHKWWLLPTSTWRGVCREREGRKEPAPVLSPTKLLLEDVKSLLTCGRTVWQIILNHPLILEVRLKRKWLLLFFKGLIALVLS